VEGAGVGIEVQGEHGLAPDLRFNAHGMARGVFGSRFRLMSMQG
jgi:hypothetical protein